jgi:opine dehydrogenase
MIVAVLGAGAIGLGSAAYLCSRGHLPVVWSRSGAGTAPIQAGNPLRADGVLSGEFRPEVAGSAKDAMARAEVVLIAAPAFAHRAIFDEVAAHARTGLSIIISSHTSMGALYLAKKLAARGLDLPIAAWGTTVTTGRRSGGGEVRITNIREKVDVATVSAARSDRMLRLCVELFGERFVPRPDLIAIALSNLNPQNHMAATLCNFTRIERAEDWINWQMHTPAVARLIGAIDRERLGIAKALGYSVRTVEEHWRLSFAATGDTLAEMAASIATRDGTKGPQSADTRYVLEDVPFGLVPTSLLGRAAGVPTPLHDAGIAFLSAMYGRDFRAENDLLPSLGLADAPFSEWRRLSREGFGRAPVAAMP